MQPDYAVLMIARDELCARIAASRAQRFDRPISGHGFSDPAEMDDDSDAAPVVETVPLLFHLIYRAADNELTGRPFKLRNLSSDGIDISASGICYLRHQTRTFLASRIVEITDHSSGEISNDE